MSKRNLIIFAIVLIILAVASQWVGRTGNKNQDDKIGQPVLDAAMVEAFDELILEGSKGIIRFKKSNDQWGIQEKNGYPVDMKKLLELIDNLTHNTVASLVTKDEKRLEYFKVIYRNSESGNDTNSGTQLTLKESGNVIFKMMAGKQREAKSDRPDMPSYPDGQYIRIGDSKVVYLIKENLLFDSDPKEWIQTTLLSIDKKEIKSVRFEVQNDNFLLRRAEKGKELDLEGLQEGAKMNDYERSSLLSELEDFKIDDILEISLIPETELELKARITVDVYDASPLTFRVYSKLVENPLEPQKKDEEKEYSYFINFVQSDEKGEDSKWSQVQELGRNWFFKMEEWKAKRWIKTRQDFIEESK
ncbi:DUF4340 domain-containing protein [bacterium]|nr:DUF4340 domain-containing protein [bacterium]